ncbi:PREDICTED: gametogenetin-like [Vollenhovia emeryi]|uniref:gametogenetin-like n=1 Tax=Vollenhovia emeryi TaxID=411798 RepID=UPI0005F5149F|nr:PREDICTED: gametogenetin-like [Vollenhovia emeryi]
MTDPTLRTPTLPRMFVPPAKPPLAGLTPSHPPGDRTSKAEKFWRKVVSRRVRNNPERIRRGIDGRWRPPEDMPVINLSEEEDGPPTDAAPASAPTAGPTIRLIEVVPRHTFRLVRPPDGGRTSAVSAAGAAAPAITPRTAASRNVHTAIPGPGIRATHTAAPIVRPPAPATRNTPATATPGPTPDSTQKRTEPRMPRDPFCVRPTPREERDVVVDGCLIRVPIGSKRWRTRIGKIKYALRLNPATGDVRHWSKRQV